MDKAAFTVVQLRSVLRVSPRLGEIQYRCGEKSTAPKLEQGLLINLVEIDHKWTIRALEPDA